MIPYLLGVLTGLAIATLHFVIVKTLATSTATEAVLSFARDKLHLGNTKAQIVDMDDPLKDIKL